MDRIKKAYHVHLIGWFLIFLLFWWVFFEEKQLDAFFSAAIVTLSTIPVFYSHFVLLSNYWNRKKIGFYIVGLILTFWVWEVPLDWLSGILQAYPAHFPTVLFAVILSGIAKGIEKWFLNILKRQELEKQAMRAELNYLRSQINPHFLFNTINNIHTLAYKNSASTPEALIRLSSLMRYMLYESNAETVTVAREIDYLKDYMELQQLRYRNKSITELQIIGDPKACEIAPLLLIHLLENAYKHSPAKLDSGEIKVIVVIKNSDLTFAIQNPIGKKDERMIKEPGGVGLQNIRKRLHLIYPGKHVFETESSEGVFKVILNISDLKQKSNE